MKEGKRRKEGRKDNIMDERKEKRRKEEWKTGQ